MFSLDGDITLVDTPGTMDTTSAEVDISNGLGIILGLKQAKTVRPVILFSWMTKGSRGEDLKKLVRYYSNIITNINYIQNFTILITKFPSDKNYETLKAEILEIA